MSDTDLDKLLNDEVLGAPQVDPEVVPELNLTELPDPFGRSGGPFLDALTLMQKEVNRAAVEDREPDFSPGNLDPNWVAPVEQLLDEKDAEIARLKKLLPKGKK